MGFGFSLLTRLKSFFVILIAGVLFLFVLVAESGFDIIQKTVGGQAIQSGILAKTFVREIILLLVVTVWFSMLFKFLPDARPSWKTVMAGGFFTGLLFSIGKLILQWLLSYNNMQTIYGASTSSVLMLLFVFYSSFIFYFGACFTKIWAESYNKPIPPAKHAEKYEWSHVRA